MRITSTELPLWQTLSLAESSSKSIGTRTRHKDAAAAILKAGSNGNDSRGCVVVASARVGSSFWHSIC